MKRVHIIYLDWRVFDGCEAATAVCLCGIRETTIQITRARALINKRIKDSFCARTAHSFDANAIQSIRNIFFYLLLN